MKKLISIFLVLCMMATLLPMVAFATEGDGETVAPIVADFTKTPKGNGLAFSAVVGDGFTVVDSKCSTKGLASVWNGKGLQFNTYQYAGNLVVWPADRSANQMFTITVNAAASGYYSTELIYEKFNKSGDFAIYINGQYAGVVNALDSTSATGIIQDPVRLNTVLLKEGDNEVSFRCVAKTMSGGTWLILDKLALTYCGDDFSPVDFSGNIPSKINAGEPVDFAVSANINENLKKFYATYNEEGTAITNPEGIVTVTSNDGTVETANQTATGATGTFTANAAGKATLTASTTINGTTYSENFEVDVIAPIVTDFTKLYTAKATNISVDTLISKGLDVVKEKSTTAVSHFMVDGTSLQIQSYFKYKWPASTDSSIMFTINVTAATSGYYSPEFIYEACTKSGTYAIYINGQYAGYVNAHDATLTAAEQRTANLNTIYLIAGKNEVSFKCTANGRTGNNNAWLILDKLTLTPCQTVPAPIGFDTTLPATIAKNEAVEFTVKPVMSDGVAVAYGTHNEDGTAITEMPIALNATSGTITDFAITSDGVSGTFTATEAGTVTLTASTTINGTTYTENLSVVVTSDEDEEVTLQNTITMSVTGVADKLTVNGTTQTSATKTYSANVGETVTVVAEDIEGKIFRGWLRGGENGTVVWLDNEYSFTAATNVAFFAKYTDAPAEAAEVNEYYDWNGEFLGDAEPAETSLAKYGFKFNEWLSDIVGKITRYVANYESDNTYTITKPDGSKLENVAHETSVTLTNPSAVSWYVNGKLAAYGTSYTFLATENATVTTDNEIQTAPIAKLDKVDSNTYIFEYNANGAEIIEKGIIIGGTTTSIISCYNKVISQRNDVSGKLMTKNDTNYTTVRGYIIYKDGNTHRVVYADIAE